MGKGRKRRHAETSLSRPGTGKGPMQSMGRVRGGTRIKNPCPDSPSPSPRLWRGSPPSPGTGEGDSPPNPEQTPPSLQSRGGHALGNLGHGNRENFSRASVAHFLCVNAGRQPPPKSTHHIRLLFFLPDSSPGKSYPTHPPKNPPVSLAPSSPLVSNANEKTRTVHK